MRQRMWVRSVGVVVALFGSLSLSGVVQASAPMTMTKVSGPYKLTLIVSPAETMSMNMKSNAAERMIAGKNATCSMSMHMAMRVTTEKSKMQACNHHLEIHVYSKTTGKVVTNAKVAISLQGMHSGAMMITVPIMTMEGMKAGPKDFHYGNNIYAAPGKYTVHVTVNGVKATFNISLAGAM